jgi:hypothetical protein
MQAQDSSSGWENQFSVDVSAFISETIPNTGIRLLRARPQTEAALVHQLEIPRRRRLLRRQSPLRNTAVRLLQDVAPVGETSAGEVVYLVLSVVVDRRAWAGGWWLAIVPPQETDKFRAYSAAAREAFALQLRRNAEIQL